MYNDIRKYGINHFKYCLVEKIVAENKEMLINLLNQKEKYYISYFNTSVDFGGYNTENGIEKFAEEFLHIIFNRDERYEKWAIFILFSIEDKIWFLSQNFYKKIYSF